MAALKRTVPLEEVHHPASAVAKDLNLDMARTRDEFLDQDALIAKARRRFALAAFERFQESVRLLDLAHALAAAAGDRLDQHRITDLVGLGLEMVRLLIVAMIARRDGHARLFHQLLGAVLQTHRLDGFGRRPHKGDPRFRAGAGELGVL